MCVDLKGCKSNQIKQILWTLNIGLIGLGVGGTLGFTLHYILGNTSEARYSKQGRSQRW